jgi:hypothetical protein
MAGCRVSEGERAGWRARTLESDAVSVAVLPERGAELVELVDRATGVDVLFKAPWGLAPPGAPPREGSDGHAFLERYAGGWQELFPSVNGPCELVGRTIPFHGEVASVAWDEEVVSAGGDELAVAYEVRSRLLPLRLRRVMRLRAGERALVLEERVTNEGGSTARFVWGHHCVVGPPLVAAGARLEAPAGTIVTIPDLWEDTARLEPGQRSAWPHARLRDGGTVDLRDVPGEEAGSHDDVYLTDLREGWVAVANASLGLRFRLRFDASLFRWIISWQPYGGARAMPLAGSYAVGIEPWTTRLDLCEAVEKGEAVELRPGESLETTLRAELEPA